LREERTSRDERLREERTSRNERLPEERTTMSGASVLFDAPGPRARVRNRVVSAVTVVLVVLAAWAVYSALESKGQLTAAKWEPFLTANLWKTYILPGVQGTLTAAGVSIVLALILGFLLGVGRMSHRGWVRWTCSVIVEFFRAVPVLIMMIFAYFLYATYDVFPSKYLALAGVITGLTLYNGAVIAEIVRAGVNALPRGQSEAAEALGLRWGQVMRSILLPQAITSMLPVLVSQMVVVLKDTAIGYQITYVEMVRQGTNVGASYGNYLPALIVVALLMICVNFGLGSLATWIEGRLRRSKRGPEPLHVAPVTQGSFGAGAGGTI
jgi:glutamate transport system permease protein